MLVIDFFSFFFVEDLYLVELLPLYNNQCYGLLLILFFIFLFHLSRNNYAPGSLPGPRNTRLNKTVTVPAHRQTEPNTGVCDIMPGRQEGHGHKAKLGMMVDMRQSVEMAMLG